MWHVCTDLIMCIIVKVVFEWNNKTNLLDVFEK